MSKQPFYLILVFVLLVATSCSTGYYGHIPRAKTKVAKKEVKSKTTTEPTFTTTVKTDEVVVNKEVNIAVEPEYEVVLKEYNKEVKTDIVDKTVNKPIVPIKSKQLVKQVKKQVAKPTNNERYGYPDASLWYFYVGVFLMVLGLIFIITPALGFGVGLPFLITGALIMILGLLF